MDEGALRRTIEAATAQVASLSLTVRLAGRQVFHHAAGLARREPARPVASDPAYDLASLTKALAGATVAASLVAEGRLDPDAPVRDVLPGVPGGITARDLLAHVSGYPAWRPLYREVDGGWGTSAARRVILDTAISTDISDRKSHVYSDIGFLVLLDLMETLGGAPLDVLFHQRVLAPAGVADLRWGWPEAAATEDCPERGHVVQGTVHDLNCAAMGGVSSHAGLFGTSQAVARLAERLLDAMADPSAHADLPGAAMADLLRPHGTGTHAGGWDRISPGYTSTGRWFPADTLGHLGYTGTSLWMSPSRRAVVVLLTNRVHPVDDLTAIRALRPALHDAVARFLGWATEDPDA